MRSKTFFIVVVGVLAVAAFGLATLQAADQTAASQGQDQWRYTFHNGEWWYWLPANRWVYWRDNQWNDYYPNTSTATQSADVAGTVSNGSRASGESDVRPFYGHALSDLDRRTLAPGSEVGPFYGNALPNEVIGRWRSRSAVRPFYGHAISSP